MGQFKRIRDALVAIALLVIPFFVLSANLRDPSEATGFDQPILQISAPIQSFATTTAGFVSDIVEDYVYLVEVEEENEALRARLARLEPTAQPAPPAPKRRPKLAAVSGIRMPAV